MKTEGIDYHYRKLFRAVVTSSATAGIAVAIMFVASGGRAISAQDKYTLQVPNGLAFSEFRGFEDWATISVSHAGDIFAVTVGNPTIMEAFRSGIPENGKPFPDGSKMAKIHWKVKQSKDAPAPTTVPDTLHDIDFMAKDSKRFPAADGWGYAQFNYDGPSDTFKPEGKGYDCGYACHTIVAGKDYVFTAYGKR